MILLAAVGFALGRFAAVSNGALLGAVAGLLVARFVPKRAAT
ncbi:MAG: hypothetical protein AB8H80_10835 [Planctomycetota bacterium]